MKTIFTLLILFSTFCQAFAQPGDQYHEFPYRNFQNVQDSIKKYPKDPFYRWVRLEIIFKPRFELHTKSTALVKDYFKYYDFYREYDGPDSIIVRRVPYRNEMGRWTKKVKNPTREMGDFLINNKAQLVKDLNLLIQQNVTYNNRQMNNHLIYSGNKPSYLYRRGKLFYLTGEPEKAREDYLTALENEPSNDLKKEILLAIAAYYYTQDSVTEESQRQALKYLDLYNGTWAKGYYYTYEEEKINLLKSLKDSTTLITYFQNGAAMAWKNYFYLYKDKYSNADKQISNAIKYEQMLFEYLKELNPNCTIEEFKEHKKIILEKIN